MKSEPVSVLQIADKLDKRKQHVFKVIRRLGIEKKLKKSATARGQRIAYVTREDYKRIKEYFSAAGDEATYDTVDSDTGGVFYIIQLEPEHDPGRIKLGFATNIDERLRSHRTAAPFSKVLETWPCKLLWEKTAIECAAQDCERLHTEIFRAKSIEAVQERCEQFFTLMPGIK